METKEISEILSRDRYTGQYFRGVYACDQLPNQYVPHPSGLIINTDPASKPGQHWVAVFITAEGVGEYFDSFGKGPSKPQIVHFLQKNTDYVLPNPRVLQNAFTTVCGQYTVFFLLHRCRGLSMTKIINMFSSDTSDNDSNVNHFIRKHFPHIKTKIYDEKFITRQFSDLLKEY